MSYAEAGPLANYNSLLDKNLSGYFANTKMRNHLVKSGLVTKSGHITSENAYRLKMAKQEHRKHVRDILANAIVDKALDMERMRQYEIRKRLDELYKIELVNKVRSERSQRTSEELIALLSPRSKIGGKNRKARSAMVRGEDRDTRLPDIHFDEKTKQLYYDTHDSVYSDNDSHGRQHQRSGKQPKKQRARSGPAKMFAPHPPATKKRKKHKVHRGLMLTNSNQLIAHRVQVQSMAEVTMKFLGSSLNLTNDMFPSSKLSEVQVIQQHCGASTVCVFRELLPANTVFTFVSRRHRGSPFGLTIYINGIINIRVSSCCEYKHKPKHKIGGKSSQFALISVHGAAPCYRCQVRLNMINGDKKEKEKEADESSTDEESAIRSYDVIVSRGGTREEKEEGKYPPRPASANATTQTGDDSEIEVNEEAKDEDYQDEDFEEEEKEFDLKEDPESSRDSSDSDSDEESIKADKQRKEAETASSGSSSESSESENEEKDGKDENLEVKEQDEVNAGNMDDDAEDSCSEHEEVGDEDSKISDKDDDLSDNDHSDSVNSDASDKDDTKVSSTEDVTSEAEKSTEVEETTEISDSAKEENHIDMNDEVKDDSDIESDSSTSSKSSKSSQSSKSSDSDSEDETKDDGDNKNEKQEEENHSSEKLDHEGDTHVHERDSSIKEEATKEDEINEEEKDTADENPELLIEETEDPNEGQNNLDDDNVGERNECMPSIISRESTTLTGNEDGDCGIENKTIQFNEEVDVVHYEKVDVEQSPEITPRSDVSDSDEDFEIIQNVSQKVMLADLGDDDDGDGDDDDVNDGIDINVTELEQRKLDEDDKDMDIGNDPDNIAQGFDANQSDYHTEVKERVVHEGSVKSVIDSWKHIELTNCILSLEQTGELLTLIDENAVEVETISLCNTILHGGIQTLKNVIKKAVNLKMLNLSCTGIGPEEALHLSHILADGEHRIKLLMLHGNPLSDEGITPILLALRKNETLTNFDVGGCGIGDEGAKALSRYLKENTTITDLTLSTNYLTAIGWHHIAEALKVNCTLKTLSIDSTNLTAEDVKIICECITQNNALVALDIEGNSLEDESGELLYEAIKLCETLVDVTLMPGNNFSKEILDKIRMFIHERVEERWSAPKE